MEADSGQTKFVRKVSEKVLRTRPHGKAEKRKQRKAWRKRKKERGREAEHGAQEDVIVPCEDHGEQPRTTKTAVVPLSSPGLNQLQLQRGKMLVVVARKRKWPEQQSKLLSKVRRQETQSVVAEKAIPALKSSTESYWWWTKKTKLVRDLSVTAILGSTGRSSTSW